MSLRVGVYICIFCFINRGNIGPHIQPVCGCVRQATMAPPLPSPRNASDGDRWFVCSANNQLERAILVEQPDANGNRRVTFAVGRTAIVSATTLVLCALAPKPRAGRPDLRPRFDASGAPVGARRGGGKRGLGFTGSRRRSGVVRRLDYFTPAAGASNSGGALEPSPFATLLKVPEGQQAPTPAPLSEVPEAMLSEDALVQLQYGQLDGLDVENRAILLWHAAHYVPDYDEALQFHEWWTCKQHEVVGAVSSLTDAAAIIGMHACQVAASYFLATLPETSDAEESQDEDEADEDQPEEPEQEETCQGDRPAGEAYHAVPPPSKAAETDEDGMLLFSMDDADLDGYPPIFSRVKGRQASDLPKLKEHWMTALSVAVKDRRVDYSGKEPMQYLEGRLARADDILSLHVPKVLIAADTEGQMRAMLCAKLLDPPKWAKAKVYVRGDLTVSSLKHAWDMELNPPRDMSVLFREVLAVPKTCNFTAGATNFGELLKRFGEAWELVRAKVGFKSHDIEEWRRIDTFFRMLPAPLQDKLLDGQDVAAAGDYLPASWEEFRELARDVNKAYGDTAKAAAHAARAQANQAKSFDGGKKRSFSAVAKGSKEPGDSSKRQAGQGSRGGGSGRGRGGSRDNGRGDGGRGGGRSGGRGGGRGDNGRGRGGGRGDGKKVHFEKKNE